MNHKQNSRREFVKSMALGGLGALAASAAAGTGLAQESNANDNGQFKVHLPVVMNEAAPPAVDEVLVAHMRKLVEDPGFESAWSKLNMDRLAADIQNFSDEITQYNTFHTRERRLWSLKLGEGKLPPHLEDKFKADIPAGIETYRRAFSHIEDAMRVIEESGFHTLLDRHSDGITQLLADERGYLARRLSSYFGKVGCAPTMLTEFQSKFQDTNYRFIATIGAGSFSNLPTILRESVDAQVNILEYTKENGFSYLQGKCGPPAWAVTVSKILAWAGISVAAWVVVVIIAALIIIVTTICALKILPSNIQQYCRAIGIPIFQN